MYWECLLKVYVILILISAVFNFVFQFFWQLLFSSNIFKFTLFIQCICWYISYHRRNFVSTGAWTQCLCNRCSLLTCSKTILWGFFFVHHAFFICAWSWNIKGFLIANFSSHWILEIFPFHFFLVVSTWSWSKSCASKTTS